MPFPGQNEQIRNILEAQLETQPDREFTFYQLINAVIESFPEDAKPTESEVRTEIWELMDDNKIVWNPNLTLQYQRLRDAE